MENELPIGRNSGGRRPSSLPFAGPGRAERRQLSEDPRHLVQVQSRLLRVNADQSGCCVHLIPLHSKTQRLFINKKGHLKYCFCTILTRPRITTFDSNF